jgi:uncharacterized membrane protein YeaQ/YmgE (transglycosylase-associated protein family)
MGLIVCVVIGLFIGWLSAAADEVDKGIFARMGIGALGAMVGIALVTLFVNDLAMMYSSWLDVFASIVGAIAVLSLAKRSRDVESRDQELA